MKKVLVYNLFANDLIGDNKCYSLHKECLKYYENIFDEIVFYINVDDLENHSLIKDMASWVIDIFKNKSIDIKVRKNTTLCEVQSFKEEIVLNKEKYIDTYVFFAHSKNSTRLGKNLEELTDAKSDSMIKWCIALYFYGLNFMNDVNGKFGGTIGPSELFYGPLLTQLKDPTSSPMLRMNKGNCHYQGTFYWINMNKFLNYIEHGIIKLPIIDDRFWVEMLPGVVGGRYRYGDGCASHNDVAINDDFNLYKAEESTWGYLIKILGNEDEFWQFYNEIMSKVL